jgi:hypothetical protein
MEHASLFLTVVVLLQYICNELLPKKHAYIVSI